MCEGYCDTHFLTVILQPLAICCRVIDSLILSYTAGNRSKFKDWNIYREQLDLTLVITFIESL